MKLLRLCALTALCATVVGAGDRPFQPPRNVSPKPVVKDADVPWVSLPPGELTPLDIVHSRTLQAGDSVDWSVEATNAPAAWAKELTGAGVLVAVHDTGVMSSHRDLKGAIKASKDFTNSPSGTNDLVGHGTHTAGSIGARKNDWGLIGQAYESQLLIGKCLNDRGSGAVTWIAASVDWASDQGADVHSLSLGGGDRDPYIPQAFLRARAKGDIIVVAAGNDGGPVSFPGAYPGCICVSAIDINKKLASFSNRGAEVKAAGPGVKVRSAYPGAGDGLFADLSGTSMATPNVAGVAALWVQGDKKAGGDRKTRPARFEAWLKDTATDLGQAGWDALYGYGLPNAEKLAVAVPPVIPPVIPPVEPGVTLGLGDLTPEARKKLTDAGVSDWSTTIRVSRPSPAPTAIPLTLDQVLALASVGPVTVYYGVPTVAGAFLLSDPPDGLEPGVYDVEKAESLKFHKKK